MTIEKYIYIVCKFGVIVSLFGVPYTLYTSNYDAAVMCLIILAFSLYMFWDVKHKERE